MTPNKRDLKAFVRYDGSGRVVAGSLILRRKKPKVGKWKEIEGYECCNPLVNIVSSDPREIAPSMSFQLMCGETVLAFQEFTGMTNWDDFIANLETYIPGFGTYTYNYTEGGAALLTLTMTSELAEALCPGGTMTIAISEI